MADKKEVKAPKEKKPKTVKKLTAKKLPPLFKKAYNQKQFDKKIVRKLYVPSDKTFVTELFKDSKDKKGRAVLKIPSDAEFTKKDITRLKSIAKDIAKNKGRINYVSFIAVAVVIVAIGLAVTIFKNPVAKWGIRSAMQGVFGAKCDIESVNIEFWNSRFTINKLAQASSDDPMKNIFQFDKLDLKFNLTQLLRGRFVSELVEITGIDTNTERTVSGELPFKPEPAQKQEEKTDSTGFYASLREKAGTDTDAAKNAFAELFAMYDPAKITENLKENLQSQKVAKEVEEELKTLVENWKNKPAEIQKSVDDLKSKTSKMASLNVSSVKTAAEAAALIKEIDSAVKETNSTKNTITSSLSSFEGDQKKVKELQKKLNDAIASDKALLNDSLSVLDINKSRALITDTVNQAGYALLGQYYPYLKQLISYAGSMKSSSSDPEEAKKANEKAKETAKKESRRFAGRDVYWKADPYPKFLLQKVHGSGKGLEINATNISSDMNRRGEPWVIKGIYNQEKRVHNANLVVDSRSSSKADLITGEYSGNNFPLVMDLAKKVSSAGMPKFDGLSTISAKLTANEDFSFGINGNLSMNPVTVSSAPLEAETANRIYSNALSSISTLTAGAKVGFSPSRGIDMNISTDFDRLLANAIKSVADKEMANVKEEAMKKVQDQLGSSDGAQKYLSQFNDISSKINDSNKSLDSIKAQFESKKKELEKKAASAATSAAKDKASSALKGLIKK